MAPRPVGVGRHRYGAALDAAGNTAFLTLITKFSAHPQGPAELADVRYDFVALAHGTRDDAEEPGGGAYLFPISKLAFIAPAVAKTVPPD